MGNLVQYVLLFCSLDGTPLLQSESYKINRDTKAIQVDTLALGMAGVSPGSAVTMIDISGAVPASGFEFQAGPKMLALAPTKVYIQGPGGLTLKSQVIITKDGLSQSVNQKATYDFSCIGPLKDWVQASGS